MAERKKKARNDKVLVTKADLQGIINLLDEMKADAITFDLLNIEEQIQCYGAKRETEPN